MDKVLFQTAQDVIATLSQQGKTLASAESFTCGTLSQCLCAASHAGNEYASGFVTYDDMAKQRMLNVSHDTLNRFTAVSAECVREMASGARELAQTDISVAVSGYGGPSGGRDGTPAGTVWFAWEFEDGQSFVEKGLFTGDCELVVLSAGLFVLRRLLQLETAISRLTI